MRRYISLLAVIVVFIIDLFQVVRADDKLEHYRRSVDEYNQEQAMMAKNIVFMELVYSKSKLLNEYRRNCMPGSFCGLTVMDLAIEGLGVNKSNAANNALIDLIVTTIDAGASEGLDCAIIIKGNDILPYLESFNIMERLKSCDFTFSSLKGKELRKVSDVTVGDICQLNNINFKRIENRVYELTQAIKSRTICE